VKSYLLACHSKNLVKLVSEQSSPFFFARDAIKMPLSIQFKPTGFKFFYSKVCHASRRKQAGHCTCIFRYKVSMCWHIGTTYTTQCFVYTKQVVKDRIAYKVVVSFNQLTAIKRQNLRCICKHNMT